MMEYCFSWLPGPDLKKKKKKNLGLLKKTSKSQSPQHGRRFRYFQRLLDFFFKSSIRKSFLDTQANLDFGSFVAYF